MKIGLANNLYPPYGRDSGAEIISKKMIDEFVTNGHEVFIITSRPTKTKRTNEKNIYFLSSSYEYLNQYSLIRKLIWHFCQLIFPPHRKEIKQIIEEEKPDLFITHNLLGLSLALPKILKQYNITHHHVLHDIQLLHPSGLMYLGEEKKIKNILALFYQYFTKKAFKQTAKIISPSKWLLDLHKQQNFFNRSLQEVIPNFNLNKKKPKEKHSPLRFLFAGQIEKHKGIAILLSAWKMSGLTKDMAQLTIVGQGSLSDFITQESKKFDNVDYLGHVSRDKINKTIKEHDIVILPSLIYENSPTIIWEAAQHGLSAIASDIGGTPELKEYLDLILFQAGNINDLSQKIREMIK